MLGEDHGVHVGLVLPELLQVAHQRRHLGLLDRPRTKPPTQRGELELRVVPCAYLPVFINMASRGQSEACIDLRRAPTFANSPATPKRVTGVHRCCLVGPPKTAPGRNLLTGACKPPDQRHPYDQRHACRSTACQPGCSAVSGSQPRWPSGPVPMGHFDQLSHQVRLCYDRTGKSSTTPSRISPRSDGVRSVCEGNGRLLPLDWG